MSNQTDGDDVVQGVTEPAEAAIGLEDGFALWIDRSRLQMTLLVVRIAPDGDIEDIVQSAVERAWINRHKYRPERGSETTWLLTITASVARDRGRLTRRRQALAPSDPNAGRIYHPALDIDVDLERVIDALPRRQRDAINCFYYLDLPIADCSQVLAVSPAAVKSMLHKARIAIRKGLGDSYVC